MAYIAGKKKCRTVLGKKTCTGHDPTGSIARSGKMTKPPVNPPKGLGSVPSSAGSASAGASAG
jgi:hypothetical protein